MIRKWTTRGTCPVCASESQSVGMLGCLRRRCKLTCTSCGRRLQTELSFATYAWFVLYIHIVLAVTGVPLIFALVAKSWIVAAAVSAAFLLCVIPLGLVLHARRLQTVPEESLGNPLGAIGSN